MKPGEKGPEELIDTLHGMPLGVFTVENQKTGDFRTFELRQQPEGAEFAPGKFVLSLLVGPSNSKDYRGFAFVRERELRIDVWKSRRAGEGETEPSQFEKLAIHLERVFLAAGVRQATDYEVLLAVPCARCGEQLTVPTSIRRGIGPVCANRSCI